MTTKHATQGGINYAGHVTVKVMSGHKVITEYSSHNEGLPALMNGICNIFTGKGTADSIRPGYIAAYTLAEDEGISAPATDTPWETLVGEDSLLSVASAYRSLDILGEPQYATANNAAAITYTAKIPYSSLTATKIHVLALLPADIKVGDTDIDKRALACYRLANSSKWLPVYCSRAESDSMLMVEWKMTFSDYGGNS